MGDWMSADTAPKDRQILADFGWPTAVVAFWSVTDSRWLTASADYNWWTTEWTDEPLKGWMEFPEVRR